jgi:hypothetical protein
VAGPADDSTVLRLGCAPRDGGISARVSVSDVTRADAERLAGWLAYAGRSQRTLSFVLFVVRAVLNQPVDHRLVSRNVATRVEVVERPVGRGGSGQTTSRGCANTSQRHQDDGCHDFGSGQVTVRSAHMPAV